MTDGSEPRSAAELGDPAVSPWLVFLDLMERSEYTPFSVARFLEVSGLSAGITATTRNAVTLRV